MLLAVSGVVTNPLASVVRTIVLPPPVKKPLAPLLGSVRVTELLVMGLPY